MRKFRRAVARVLCAALFLTVWGAPSAVSRAATADPPPPIAGLTADAADIVLDNQRGTATVQFAHSSPGVPPLSTITPNTVGNTVAYTNRVVKYYLDEHEKAYRGGDVPERTYEDERVADWTPDKFEVPNLPSGTIFDVQATTYMRFTEGPPQGEQGPQIPGQTGESARSNRLTVFTGVQLEAELASPDQIRLIWDDVWYNGRRINGYDINIYTSSNISPENLQGSVPITESQIGPGRPVTVNEGTGKLEYTYRVPYPGRVYTFVIEPRLNNVTGVVEPAEGANETVASSIAVSVAKLAENPDGSVTWEIRWSNVTAGMGSNMTYKAEYTLSKMSGAGGYQVLQVISNDTSTVLVTKPEDAAETDATYRVSAVVFAGDDPLYEDDGVTIESAPFTLRESERPYTPQAPILTLDEAPTEQNPASARLWWNIPKMVTEPETDDRDVRYQLYILTDPELIDTLSDPETASEISPDVTLDGMSLTPGPPAGGGADGYLHTVENLQPNTTYYMAVRAVKNFIEITDMSLIERYSEISYVVVTTPPQAPFGQPPAPVTLEYVENSVTTTSAAFSVQTLWYEKLDAALEPDEWIWQPGYDPGTTGALPEDMRKLNYEAGDQLLLYYAPYAANMNVDNTDSMPSGTFSSVTLGTIDPRNPEVRMTVPGLTPNTVYVFWARAARVGQPNSRPSKTVLVTTPPDPNTDAETPTVPDFEFVFIGDTYVDMLWEKKPGYAYSVQISATDDFTAADVDTRVTSTDEIAAGGTDFYRVTDLTPDTLYYFRLRAEVTSQPSGEVKMSGWSDSKPARTKPPMPPAVPSGFGIKSVADAITKDSIFYEWRMTEGLTYILEYARDAAMLEGVSTVDVGTVAEHRLTGLLSNHRYYARLYALDPVTGLRSEPTYIIGARTRRSDDDYDANVDTTLPITGEYVELAQYAEEGIWHVKILGTDADRFVERVLTDTMLDFVIDLTEPPRHTETVCLTAEGKVFESLDNISANLELQLADKSFVIRPRTLSPDMASSGAARRLTSYRYEILVGLGGGFGYEKPDGMSLKSAPSGFEVNVLDGGTRYPIVGALGKGVRVVVPFSGASWYTAGETSGVYVDADGMWQKLATVASFDPDTRKGRLVFEYAAPGSFFAADIGGRGMFADVSGGRYAEYVNRLGALGYTDTRAGMAFRPNDPVAPAEAAEMLTKAMGGGAASATADATAVGSGTSEAAGSAAANDERYLYAVVKAGFIESAEQTELKIEEALALVGRAYAVRAGRRVPTGAAAASSAVIGGAGAAGETADGTVGGAYAPGLGELREPVRSYAQFALDNGLASPVVPSPAGPFPSGRAATRAETAAFICMALELLGEV